MKEAIHLFALVVLVIFLPSKGAALSPLMHSSTAAVGVQMNDSIPDLKPAGGVWGFGFRAEGLRGMIWDNNFDSLTLQLRYVAREATIFRADFGLAFLTQESSEKDAFTAGGYRYEEDSEDSFTFSIAPGMEQHFRGTRRLDPYIGVSLPLAFAGKRHIIDIDETINSNGTFSKREIQQELPGGFGVGLNGLAGLNYFIADRIALGLEYSLGASLVRIKGPVKIKTTNINKTTPTGAETITITQSGEDEVTSKASFLGNKGVAGINLVFYIGR